MRFLNKWRWPRSWYDLCQDGIFKHERLKGKYKRHIRKKTLKKQKEINEKE